jgi:hypothetical protein
MKIAYHFAHDEVRRKLGFMPEVFQCNVKLTDIEHLSSKHSLSH